MTRISRDQVWTMRRAKEKPSVGRQRKTREAFSTQLSGHCTTHKLVFYREEGGKCVTHSPHPCLNDARGKNQSLLWKKQRETCDEFPAPTPGHCASQNLVFCQTEQRNTRYAVSAPMSGRCATHKIFSRHGNKRKRVTHFPQSCLDNARRSKLSFALKRG